MNREQILAAATAATTGPREETYGDCYRNMLNFASLLGGYAEARWGVHPESVTAEDAAHIMVLAKMARTLDHKLPPHDDNYVDGAAYFAIAGEVAAQERE